MDNLKRAENSPNNLELRTMKDGNWFWAPRSIIKDRHFTPSDKLVYFALASFDGMEKIMP